MNYFKHNIYAHCFALCLIFFAVAAIYYNSLKVPFQFDDIGFIVGSPEIHNADRFLNFWNKTGFKSRIVVLFTFFLNYQVHQLDVVGYHIINIIIHVFVGWSLFWFYLILLNLPKLKQYDFSEYAYYIALAAALLFCVHPIQTQAVTYISQRFTSLSTLFYILSLCFYLKLRLLDGKNLLRGVYIIGLGICGLLGMFSKEIVFSLPVMILVLEYVFLQQKGERLKQAAGRYKWGIIFLVIISAICVLFWSYNFSEIFRYRYSQSHEYDVLHPFTYFLTQFKVLVIYVKLLIFPIHQSLDYDIEASNSLLEIDTFLCFLFLSGLILLAAFYRKKQIVFTFAIIWFFVTLAIESSFIPIRNVIFEHRMYLPSVGFFLVLSTFLLKVCRIDVRKFGLVVLIFVCALGVLTVKRNRVWQSEVSLWKNVIEQYPKKSRSHLNLANAYMQQNQPQEAIDSYKKSLRINPNNSEAYNNLGLAYMNLKEYNQALLSFQKALLINPDSAKAHNNLGTLYVELKRYPEALDEYREALKNPHIAIDVHINRADVYIHTGEIEKAFDELKAAANINPKYVPIFMERARIYQIQGQYDLAFKELSKAIDIDARNSSLYLNRANISSRKKSYEQALDDYNEAIALEPDKGIIYLNRAMMYKAQNKYERMQEDLKRAQDRGINIPQEMFK